MRLCLFEIFQRYFVLSITVTEPTISCPANTSQGAIDSLPLVRVILPAASATDEEGQPLIVTYNYTLIRETTAADGPDSFFIEGKFPVGTTTIMAMALAGLNCTFTITIIRPTRKTPKLCLSYPTKAVNK